MIGQTVSHYRIVEKIGAGGMGKGRVKVLDFGLATMLRPVIDEATTEALTHEQATACA